MEFIMGWWRDFWDRERNGPFDAFAIFNINNPRY